MATIKPFKAIRPAVDKVSSVVSRSYQDYSRKELNSILMFNPFSFLHIVNPGYKFSKRVTGTERFKLVYNRYLEFLEGKIFIKDALESFYIYKITDENKSYLGIFCSTSIKDYENNIIKKHEATLEHREKLFASYLQTVTFNAEPVLMTYPDNDVIAKILSNETKKQAEYFFTTTDKVTHKLWTVTSKSTITALQTEFKKIDALYIADGHHRSASSYLYAQLAKADNKNHSGKEPYNYFMSYLIPESEVNINGFNRVVKDLNGLSKQEFLIKLDAFFRIENKGRELYKPSKKHHFSMYMDGEFYSLYLRKKIYTFTDALSQLDTQILFKTVLEPILGIRDLRNDKRIEYGFDKHNSIKMKDEIDAGKYKVGFSLVPITIEEIKAIANAGLVMPPKSTYIKPKLRSGIAMYEL